jgi:hypothetical protein
MDANLGAKGTSCLIICFHRQAGSPSSLGRTRVFHSVWANNNFSVVLTVGSKANRADRPNQASTSRCLFLPRRRSP